MKEKIKILFGESNIQKIFILYNKLYQIFKKLMYPYGKYIKTPLMVKKNFNKSNRKLEIGPGINRLSGFETLNVDWDFNVDYVIDASKRLPFFSGSFDLIYSSHVFEHFPWYRLAEVLKEWVRIIKNGGRIEILVPDGLKICETLTAFEKHGIDEIYKDGWYRFNPERDPCVWAAGRLFTYGDGSGNPYHWNWHRALFTPRYLKKIMEDVGLVDIRQLDTKEVRGVDHGWISLGMIGTKKVRIK